MNYDLNILDPIEFEQFVGDLFSREWNTILESFKPGKDQGIDLRHCFKNKTTIVQCKRYNEQKIAQLKSNLKGEVKKIEKLKPDRYILATSIPLSELEKKSILEILSPWCSCSDIYGKNELITLLKKHEEVERQYFKLWISSTTVLEKIVHSDIFNYSKYKEEEIKREIGKLITHKGLPEAIEKIRENNHVLIAGIPGIGKTTLAKMICCQLIVNGYQIFWVTGRVENAWKIVHKEKSKKIVIIYDDFLGRSEFNKEKFDKNEDFQLTSLIKKSTESENLIVILTTREHILEDAKSKHGHFSENSEGIEKYTVSLDHYTPSTRARILFNHLLFSDLPDTRIDVIIDSKIYRSLITHKNFNPRIIENIAKNSNSKKLTDDDFIKYLEESFSNPFTLWDHPFEKEISNMAREVLLIICTYGNKAEISEIKRSVRSKWKGNNTNQKINSSFMEAMKQLEGNFLTTNRVKLLGTNYYFSEFSNPSIEEFIEQKLIDNPEFLMDLGDGFIYPLQIVDVTNRVLRKSKETNEKLEVCEWLLSKHDKLIKEKCKKEPKTAGSFLRDTLVNPPYFHELRTKFILKNKTPNFEIVSEILRSDAKDLNGKIGNNAHSFIMSATQFMSFVKDQIYVDDNEKGKIEVEIRWFIITAIQSSIIEPSISIAHSIIMFITDFNDELTEHEEQFFGSLLDDLTDYEIETIDDPDEIDSLIEYLSDIETRSGIFTGDKVEKLSERRDQFFIEEEDHSGFSFLNEASSQENQINDLDGFFTELKNR